LTRAWVLAGSGVVVLGSGVGLTLGLTDGTDGPEVSAAPSQPAPSGPPPVVFDEASATLSAQDAYSTTSVDKNGVFRTVLSPTVVNVKMGDEWVPASATLTDDGASGLEALQHPLALSLASTADDPELVSVSSAGYSVTFALKGAADAPLEHVADSELPSTVADHAVYAEVFPGTDLEYDVSPSALKESVVLSEAPTSDDVSYTWSVSAPGLVVERNEFDDLEFLDPAGEVIFAMPIPVMWDSSGVEGVREPADANIPFEVVKVGDGAYELTLRPGAEWLRDSARVYPVYVDPTLGTGPFLLREYKSDGVVYAKDVRVGRTQQNPTCCDWRSVAAYDYSSLLSRQITYAQLYSSRLGGTANCFPGNVFDATYWGFGGLGTQLSGFPNCTTGNAGERIYQAIAAWVKAGSTQGALVFTGAEWNAYSYKILSTALYIDWVYAPTVTSVTDSTPADGEMAVAFPVMQAIGTNDIPTSPQSFQYIFTSTDGGAAWTSPWASTGPYRVPDGALTPGKHYTYSIKTKNDYPVSPEPVTSNAAWNFTMDAAPNTPTDVTVDGHLLTGNVTSGVVRPVVSASVSDVDGGSIQALFTIRQNGIVIVDSLPGTKVVLGANAPGVSSATLPYALSPDATYTIEVRSFDGYLVSATSLAPTFTFTGPPGTNREIPGTSDTQTSAVPTTGATS
jgi:hypothetical protein